MSLITSFAHGMWYAIADGRARLSRAVLAKLLLPRGRLWPVVAADARAQVQDMGSGCGVAARGGLWEGRKADRSARGGGRHSVRTAEHWQAKGGREHLELST